jgi:hypothetical protein
MFIDEIRIYARPDMAAKAVSRFNARSFVPRAAQRRQWRGAAAT